MKKYPCHAQRTSSQPKIPADNGTKRNFHNGWNCWKECFDKIRETCGSSLAVLRVHLVLLNQASTLGIVRSRERSTTTGSKKKIIIVNAWYQWMCQKTPLCSLFSHTLKVHGSFRLVIMNRGTQGMDKQVMTASTDTESKTSTICSPTLNAADTQNTKICQA